MFSDEMLPASASVASRTMTFMRGLNPRCAQRAFVWQALFCEPPRGDRPVAEFSTHRTMTFGGCASHSRSERDAVRRARPRRSVKRTASLTVDAWPVCHCGGSRARNGARKSPRGGAKAELPVDRTDGGG